MYKPLKNRRGPIRRWMENRPFLFLTLALLILLICMPLATTKLSRFLFVELTFILVLGVGVSATGYRRWFIGGVLILWMVSAGLELLAYFRADPSVIGWLTVINELSSLVFLLCCIVFLLRFIFSADKVNTNSVFAATSSYLLLALIWAFAYHFVYKINPQAFNLPDQAFDTAWLKMVYFSLVTITTLGYGDILPVSPFARMLAGVEAVVGQLYLAVLIAWLVGLTISNRQYQKWQCSEKIERDLREN